MSFNYEKISAFTYGLGLLVIESIYASILLSHVELRNLIYFIGYYFFEMQSYKFCIK